jgi:tetratricopeptide (TPR) repeat protein
MAFCTNCGAKNDDGVRFCVGCGTSFGGAPTQAGAGAGGDAQEAYDRGAEHLGNEEFDEAVEAFTEALRIEPGRADAHFVRGEVYRMQEMHAEAIADFTKAISMIPSWADPYNSRAIVYSQTGEGELCLKDCDAVIRLDPDNAGMAHVLRAAALMEEEEHEKAITDLTKAIELSEDMRPMAYFSRAFCHKTKGRWAQAIQDAKAGLQLDPDPDTDVLPEDPKEIIAYAEKMLAQGPAAPATSGKASFCTACGAKMDGAKFCSQCGTPAG